MIDLTLTVTGPITPDQPIGVKIEGYGAPLEDTISGKLSAGSDYHRVYHLHKDEPKLEFDINAIPNGLHVETLKWVEKLLDSRSKMLYQDVPITSTLAGIAAAEKLVREVRHMVEPK